MKLNKLNSQRLTEKKMNNVRGGRPPGANCGCGCASASTGGSSDRNNAIANAERGITSSGDIKIWVT